MNMTQATYELVMERGPEIGQTFPLTLPSHTIGRDPISDICVSDPEVSRQHGLLIQAPSGDYRIQDLGSTNGTVVDGRRLSGDAYTLQAGQLITLGGSVALRYRQRERTEEQATGVDSETLEEPPRIEPAVVTADPEQPAEEPASVAATASAASGEEPSQADDRVEWLRTELPPASQEVLREKVQGEIPATAINVAETDEAIDPGRRVLSIALGILLLLLCLCCSVTVFTYYVGGDWLLREMGVVP